MNQAEYKEKEAEILEDVPEEFRSAISLLAYERGHSCGWNEVLLELDDLVDVLSDPIKQFEQRITKI